MNKVKPIIESVLIFHMFRCCAGFSDHQNHYFNPPFSSLYHMVKPLKSAN